MMKFLSALRYALIGGLMAVLLYGCVYSVHPLFTEEELLVRHELLGKWQADEDEFWEFTRGDGQYYDVIHVSEGDTSHLEAGLGKLGEFYFLDFAIGDIDKLHEMELYHLFPTHTFARISFGEDRVILEWFATQWLEDLIKDKRIRIAHERENKQVLLTASTEELQKFIRKYSYEPKAFEEPRELQPTSTR